MSAYAGSFRTSSFADRAATHERLAAEKADDIAARRALAETYLAHHPSNIDVAPERAVAVTSLIEETGPAREEAAALADGRKATIDNGSLEYPVLGHELPADGPAMRLGADPIVLAPVVRYCGMVPILFNAFVTRAFRTELLRTSAHHFHLDPEDVRSFKVFVHLTDVDRGSGPFHALPADLTQQVLDAVGYRGIDFLEDEQVAEVVGWDQVVQVLGPAGTVAFADTTRCLHFGGRPRDEGQPVREMLVFQYLLPTSVLFTGEKAHGARDFLHQLEPTGDAVWDALIGAAHA
ncbi:MAG: hypothetical protein QOD30_720 [Actinomycetota bacterium]|nr:hypothetical protein [Actinomycetota bacterium]